MGKSLSTFKKYQSNISDKIKVHGQTSYKISLTLYANCLTSPIELQVIETYSLYKGDENEKGETNKTTVFKQDCMDMKECINVSFEYITRLNASYIYLEAITYNGNNCIEISDIQCIYKKEFEDCKNLSKRKPWGGPKTDFFRNNLNWETLLEDSGTYFLAGNMLMEQTSIEHAPDISILPNIPGIQSIVFFPSSSIKLDYIGQKEGGLVADVAKLHFYENGSEIELKRKWVKWYPHKVEMNFEGDDISVRQTSTITREDQIVCKLEIHTHRKLILKTSCDYNGNCAGAIDVFKHNNKSYVLSQNGLGVYLGFTSSAAVSPESFYITGKPLQYTFEASNIVNVIYLMAAVGMERKLVESRLFNAMGDPEKVFEDSYNNWNDYFNTTVPKLSSDNFLLNRLYYMYCYSHMANSFDIYYEPYIYPYVCPNKTLWKPQWIWNITWGMMSERWLNDTYLSEGGIRNEIAINSQLSYTHELEPISQFILKDQFWSGEEAGGTGAAFYPLLDLYKRNGDKNFLKKAYNFMRQAEEFMSTKDIDGDGLPEFSGNIDEYDQSVRWLGLYVDSKEYAETEENMNMHTSDQVEQLFFHTKAVLIDYSVFLLILRRNLGEVSDFLGFHKIAEVYRDKAKELQMAINDKMWSEEEGFYFDYSLKHQKKNLRWIISGITPLMGKAATNEQAKRVVENLTDKETMIVWEGKEYKAGKFCWNLYPPCTASVLNKYWRPDEKYGYGLGQTMMTGGARYTLEVLINYGYFDEARYLINKLFQMQTGNNGNSLHLPYTYNSLTGKENKTHMAQQTAIFNDIIFSYILGIRLRMDNKFEFMPFDVLKDFGPINFGPFYTKTYPIEVTWDGKTYSVKIEDEKYELPYLTKWVIPVAKLEENEKNKLMFHVKIEAESSSTAIFEVKVRVHDDEYVLLRLPVAGGYEKDFTIGANEVEGYESVIDFALYTPDNEDLNVSISNVDLFLGQKRMKYTVCDGAGEMLTDTVQKNLRGKVKMKIAIVE